MQPTKPPFLARPTPPYDTGRVKIGICYDPPVKWSASRDSYNLQTALLPRSAVRATTTERLLTFFRSFV